MRKKKYSLNLFPTRTRVLAALLAMLMAFSIADTALPFMALAEDTPEKEETVRTLTAEAFPKRERDEDLDAPPSETEEPIEPGYRVTVTCDENAALPATVELKAEELKPEALKDEARQTAQEEFDIAVELVTRKLNLTEKPLVRATVLDLSLTDPQTGEVCQPGSAVKVEIDLLERKLDSNIWPEVAYLRQLDGMEEPAAIWVPVTVEPDKLSFETEYFSRFVILEYEINPTETPAEENPEAADSPSTDTLVADAETVQVSASFDENAGLPEGVELGVTELTGEAYDAALEQTAQALDLSTEDISVAAIIEVSITDPESGETVQPQTPVEMSVQLAEAGITVPENAQVIRLDEEATVLETVTVQSDEGQQSIAFSDEKVAVYAIVETTLEKTLTASDGNVYDITVSFGPDAGIPADAVLSVREILEGEPEYAEYIAACAEALGQDPEDLVFARPFDICLLNPETGEEYQPTGEVKVSIRLLDTVLDDSAQIDVLHIGDETETMDATVNGENVEFTTEGFSVYVVVRRVIEQTLTASDGNEYRITVTYDSESGIPEDAELIVTEIKAGDEGYERYVSESAEKLEIPAKSVSIARAFDITLKNPETGEEYQPTKDVRVSIQLLSEKVKEDANVGVVHFGEETEVMDATVNGEAVEFKTAGFSVYVIVADEGGEIKTPRVEFHFLSQTYAEDSENPGAYTADTFFFINKAGTRQNSQILIDGEALEMIQNPPNLKIDNGDGTFSYRYFYGWYIVDEQAVNDGIVTYTWEVDPEQIHFEKAITIDASKIVWNNDDESSEDYHTAITSLVWEMDGVAHEVKAEDNSGTRIVLDEFGCAHVYLAPIYEEYYFINFYAGKEGSDLGNSIITRRLVVLGSDGKAEIRIGDVQATSSNAQHEIFTGWTGKLWDEAGNAITQQEMTTLDDVGDEINTSEDKDGFYITVDSHDLNPEKMEVDLYPIFTEARWFHFRTGGSGSTYVGDTYVYTTYQPSDVEDGTAKYYLTDMAISSRIGYRFKGWYADATETDSNGDYIDGRQITDENGQIVNPAYTKYDTDGVTPLYQIKDGRLYAYKDISDEGVTLYAHWEEDTDAKIQVIIWRQKVSDSKNAYDYQKTYDFEASYTIDTNSGLTLGDLRANNVLRDYEDAARYVANVDSGADFTGFHYRTSVMNTDRTKGDGSTAVNVYYDRDLMTIYFYYSGNTGEPAYTYTQTTNNTPEEQYGIVEGEYVRLVRKQGSGMKYTFRYDYQTTTSDTIEPQFALVSYTGGVKLYEELTREVETVTNTRWRFITGTLLRRTTRYMDQGATDGKFYVWNGGLVLGEYEESGYTVDNPPPANDGNTYYCYYNNRHYELTPQSTTTTTYTWKLNGVVWTGTRYRRLAGTAEYTGTRYTISGDSTNTYGIDSRGGYVELNGTAISAYQWFTTTHVEDYYLDNDNDGTQQDVYGLVDGQYVKLTPVMGDTYTYTTENTYTQTDASNTAQSEQYGLVDGEYVPLRWEVVETIPAWTISSVYTPTTRTSDGYYYIYWNYGFQNTQLYRYNNKWYRNRIGALGFYTYSNEWTGGVYERSTTSSTYSGTVYGLTTAGAFTTYSSGTRYGDGGNGVIYQLGNQTYTERYGWAYNGTEYTGNRYLKGAGADWTGDRYTRTGDAAPYTYTQRTENPTTGLKLYIADGNGGHVALNWSVNVTGYTYEDAGGNAKPYTGDRYTFISGEIETEYTGIRFTRSPQSGGYSRMLTYIGLYGQTLAQAGYTWPDTINGTNYIWYSSTNTQTRSRLTFLDAFLFAGLGYATNNNTVLKLYGTASSQTGTYIYFYKQNLDGTYPALGLANATNAIPTSSGGRFSFTNKYNGFELDTYSTNNGSTWNTATVDGTATTSDTGLHIRFRRLNYNLIFDPNYPKLAGTTIAGTELTMDNIGSLTAANTTTLSIPFETPLSGYSSQPQPAQGPDNYTFNGWYVDATCTQKYTFGETMPDANMRLYAGWTAVRFRVKIDPNGGEFDHINHKWNNSSDNLALRGYADSGAAWWWVDNGDGTQTAQQYSAADYDPATWTPFVNFNRGEILAEDNTVERAADSGWAATSRYSTYINANYMASVSEYTNMKCEYVPISDAFAENYNGTVYYYMNAQFQSDAIDGSGLPSANRSALYMTESELHDYYLFYKNWVHANLVGGYITGTTILDEETWRETYVSPQKYRHTIGSESYTFLGWYKLDANGNPETMPYNFSDPVTGEFTLKAYWRLDAGYQIRYSPEYTMDDGTIINGSMLHWTDPQVDTSRYTDKAKTYIYRQPTGITANGLPTEEYIFRGWRLVNISTNAQGQPVYTPLENNVFYDPGDRFTVHAAYADRNSVIHMQAVYEKVDSSYRRPYTTSLVLDANGGFLTLDGENELQTNTDLSSTWDGVIGTVAATVDVDGVAAEMIEFGNIQSNEDVHLYRYATELAYVDGDDTKAELDPAGKNYFKHPNNYFLLGFDDAANEGDYVAAYPADSVIGVQRNEPEETRTKYAVWEPLVYIKVVNATDVGPVTFGLSSSEGALQVVNARDGLYGRTPMTAEELSHITVADGDYIWLAVPYGVVKEIVGGETTWVKRHITITGTNELGPGWLLSAKSELNGEARDTFTGSLTGTNADYTSVKNQNPFGFNEVLEIDPEGIVITFTAIQNPHTLVLDDNYPTTGVRTREVYFDTKDNTASSYGYDIVYGQEETLYYDLPTTSTRIGYIFLGWDPDPDWMANHPDYETTGDKPAYTTGSAAGWRIDPLTDFFQNDTDPTELDSVKTLYAVWDSDADSQIVYIYKEVPEPGDQEKAFTFTVNMTGEFKYQSRNSNNGSWKNQTTPVTLAYVGANHGPYELKNGEYLKLESFQFIPPESNTRDYPYIQIKINMYNADNELQYTDILKWIGSEKNGNKYKALEFDVEYSVSENNYSAAPHYYDTTLSRIVQTETYPLMLGDSTDTTTVPLEGVEGRVVTWTETDAGGTVVFTNTRQTADVTVKKVLESDSSVAGVFSFTASYALSGATTDLGAFSVTSGTEGYTLEDIPVGAVLTVREVGTLLNDYETTVRQGETDMTVTETTSTSGSTTTYARAVDYSVAKGDAEITYTNKLKSYPVTFYKVDQDGNAGVPSYFTLAASTGEIGRRLYPSQTGTGEFFPGTSGLSNELYVGTYTLTETFVGTNFLPLEGPVTLTLSSKDGGTLTSSNTDYVVIEKVDDSDPAQGFKVYVYNQRIVKLKIEKVLDDPILSSTRAFQFHIQYEYQLLGKTVRYDNAGDLLSVRSGSPATISIPVNAKLTITEVLSETDAATYDTSVVRTDHEGTADAKIEGTTYIYSSDPDSNHGIVLAENEGDTITFTNVRKTVDVTIRKTVLADDTSGDFAFTVTILNGALPVADFTAYDGGTPNDSSDDWVTDGDGVVMLPGGAPFSLQHNQSRTIKIPVGADVTLKEELTDAQKAADITPFIFLRGTENLTSGESTVYQLKGPTEASTIIVYNIPAICKVTNGDGNLLYFHNSEDDIYIPAIYGTIHGAFDDINAQRLFSKSGSTYTAYSEQNYQVQMLRDYEVPNSDVVEVNSGLNLTFTTADMNAADGYKFRRTGEYPGAAELSVPAGGSIGRAVLSRTNGSTKAFFTVSSDSATQTTVFAMSKLIIDGAGADLENDVRGGCLTAYKADVTVDSCVIYQFEAAQGGAVYTTGDSLKVTNSVFDTCKSGKSGSGNGGGAINTTAYSLTITGTSFQGCSAIWQGGAVYHYGTGNTGATKKATITNCSFINCFSRAGGGAETDVGTVSLTNCTFTDCKAQNMPDNVNGTNGGGLNTYTANFGNTGTLTLNGCHFYGCTAVGSGTGRGGGLHSTHSTNTLIDCTIGYEPEDPSDTSKGCSAKEGGGAAFTNANGTTALSSCTISNCSATSGGGVYTSGNTEIQDDTVIEGCTATSGGGVYLNNAALTMSSDSSVIRKCTSSKNGGAIFATGSEADVQISAGEISANKAKGFGGGALRVEGGASATVSGTAQIKDNAAVGTGDVYGGAINIKKGSLTISGGTFSGNYAQSTNSTSYGGAIHVSGTNTDGGTLTITGGTISNNYVNSSGKPVYGGAISVKGTNAKMEMSGGAISGNRVTTEGANKDACGGAIAVLQGAELTLSGGTISGNTASAATANRAMGAGIYLGYNSVDDASAVDPGILSLSGSPSFGGEDKDDQGNFDNGVGNCLDQDPDGTNGGKSYTQIRQDIYLAGYSNVNAGSIHVTGKLDGENGSIWVWAAEQPHFKEKEQFAVIDDSITDPGNLAVFRNARIDGTGANQTGATTMPLYGVRSNSDASHVIWGTIGGAEVSFLKIDGFGQPLQGAKFSLYSDAACSTVVTVTLPDGSSATEVVSNGNGQVRFNAPANIYYMKETSAPNGFEANTKVYIVLVGAGNLTIPSSRTGLWADVLSEISQADVNSQRGALHEDRYEKDSVVFLVESGKAVTTPDIASYGIMNVAGTHKVILRKTDTSFNSLEDAEFEIFRYDMTRMNWGSDNLGASGPNGVFFIGDLPEGYYYLHETAYPSGMKTNPSDTESNIAGWWYTIKVNEDGTFLVSGPLAERKDPNKTA